MKADFVLDSICVHENQVSQLRHRFERARYGSRQGRQVQLWEAIACTWRREAGWCSSTNRCSDGGAIAACRSSFASGRIEQRF
ncbi:hypothetical protein Poly51_46340 [Rubripirellula tenax]|uniref:Uncharacterized protein n=1 Tax=Rubripirellula tenax TaxID=2528015 RepID=A0A5C6EI66_9BACT|nr:hypothetical protein Poly51_46340 [Rubripirellula tenax]